MQAIIIGATGATGKDLLQILLNDRRYSGVKILVRKPTGISHPKLEECVVDFDNPEQWKNKVAGDVLFSCLGTTLKAAGSKEAQYKVDFTYQYEVARAAKENGVSALVLVSSSGANASSPFFYMKMKGELEEAVKGLHFDKMIIFRPPVLKRKNSDRLGEKMSLKVIEFFNSFGLLKSQKPLPTEQLAQAMAERAIEKNLGTLVLAGANFAELN